MLTIAHTTIDPADLIAQIGCDAVLTKPLQMDHLMDLLHTHLGVEWIYENIRVDKNIGIDEKLTNKPFVLPPAAHLERLRGFAEIFAFTELMEEITHLREQDRRYEPFADHIVKLLKDFQFEAILKAIEAAEKETDLT